MHFSYAEQIRAYVPMRYTVLGTDGFGRFEPGGFKREVQFLNSGAGQVS